MGEAFIMRSGSSGGAGINFNVVGGTMQPTGKENLVWVNTETSITNWVVSPNQPENPTAGMVWIYDATDNGINIVKKNVVEIFPTGCAQFVNGIWEFVESYIYKNGKWTQLKGILLNLYNNGDECDDITGGWALGTDSTGRPLRRRLTKESDSMVFTSSATETTYSYGFLCTVNPVPFGNFKNLKMEYENAQTQNAGYLVVSDDRRDLQMHGGTPKAYVKFSDGSGAVSLPISEFAGGEYYVGPAFGSIGVGQLSVTIKRIWLE